ncbi:MAG: hypothetical protein JOY53_10760, partial [Acidobacteriaceae bacterium]|nr:hypothetical protein [Acidobacteriaceae bacterium]
MHSEPTAVGTLSRGNITYFPVVPGRIEFALRLRRYLLEHRPRVIAVELPRSLEHQYEAALKRMPQMSVIVISDASDDEEEQATYIPVEPGDPFVEALRTAHEFTAEIVLLEPPTHTKPHIADAYPEPYSIEFIGLEQYLEAYRLHPPQRTAEIESHAAAMGWKLQGSNPLAATCAVVSLNMLDPLLDAMEIPQDEPPRPRVRLFGPAELFNLHPDSLAEVTNEPPNYQERYEQVRAGDIQAFHLDRSRWQLALLRDAEKEYSINTGDSVQSWQRRTLAKFTRNLSLLDGRLVPGAYDLTLGARAIVDDNYGYEVWQMANRYSVQQTEDPPLETLNISGEDVWIRTKKLRIRRRLPRMKQMFKPVGLKPRKKEKHQGEWASQTSGTAICSYPLEDLVIENYGRFLKRYAKTTLSQERSRVEPFTTSMLDGLDLRETVRNWTQGKLYVREMGKFSGDVGALVIIF